MSRLFLIVVAAIALAHTALKAQQDADVVAGRYFIGIELVEVRCV